MSDEIRQLAERIARLEAGESAVAEQLRLVREEMRKIEQRVWFLATAAAGAGAAGATAMQAMIGG